jgi:hypothetical protein
MGLIQDLAMAHATDQIATLAMMVAQKSVDLIKERISIPFPPASRPGRPPHLREGLLREGIDWTMASDEVIVISAERQGTPGAATRLELGDSDLAPRPFLQPMMYNTDSVVADAVRELRG